MSTNIYDYLREQGEENEEKEEKEEKEENEDTGKAIASYITYCKANYQNKLNTKIRKSFEKSDTYFQKCRFNKDSEGHILFMDEFTTKLLQLYQYMEIKSITLAKTPIINKQTGVQLAIHVYLIINIEDAIVLSTDEEKKKKLYGDDRYTPKFHEFLSEKYKKKDRVSLIIERHERVGIEYYFKRAEVEVETNFLTIDFSMSKELEKIRAYMKNYLPPTKILEILISFPSFPFKIILGEFVNNAIVYYTMNLEGRMPYGMGLLTFWSKYSLAQNNCQLFAFSCLYANFLLPSEIEIHFLRDIDDNGGEKEEQLKLEKYCTKLSNFYEADIISLLGIVPNKVFHLYGGPTSGKESSNMIYMNSTFVVADKDDEKCITDCYTSPPECFEACHIKMFTKVECVMSKALAILYTKSLETIKKYDFDIKHPEKFNLFLEKYTEKKLYKHIKELEDSAFMSALEKCKNEKLKLSRKFSEIVVSSDLSFFKKHKT